MKVATSFLMLTFRIVHQLGKSLPPKPPAVWHTCLPFSEHSLHILFLFEKVCPYLGSKSMRF